MTHMEMALCTEMSDHHYDVKDLFLFSASLKTKMMPNLNKERIESIFNSYHTRQGERMLRTMIDLLNPSLEFRTRMVCARLLENEQESSESIWFLVNPSKKTAIISALQKMGIVEEVGQNREQYLRDAIWNNEEALMRVLPSSWLINDAGDKVGKWVHCWTGSGRYIGTHLFSAVEDDFKQLGMERVSLVFLLGRFYPMLADALEAPKEKVSDAAGLTPAP